MTSHQIIVIVDLDFMVKLKKYFPLSIAFLVGIILCQTISYIHAQEGNLIHGCVKTNNGALRILGVNDACNSNETPLDWNIQGPAGPVGPTGATGTGGGGSSYPPNACPSCDLTGIDRSGEDIRGVYLPWANLSNGHFVGTNLSESMIDHANCSYADFTNASLSSSNAYMTNFNNANFTNADLSGMVTTQNDVIGAIWNNTICPDASNSNDNGNTCEGHL